MQTTNAEPSVIQRPSSRPAARTPEQTATKSSAQAPEQPTAKPTGPAKKAEPEKRGELDKRSSAEKRVELVCKLPQARSVAVAGTFNNWDCKKTPMVKDSSTGWKTTLTLLPGRYEYRFVVDGQWVNDPEAKESATNPFGSTNSVLVV
jgi:Glycogen recognition site of AMP-activated protein kinase